MLRRALESVKRRDYDGEELTHDENQYLGLIDDILKEGVMVRSMSSFGLNDYVRVTIGLPEENRKFLAILEKVMKSANGSS